MVLGWSVFLGDPGRSAPSLAGLVGLLYTTSALLGRVFILVILYYYLCIFYLQLLWALVAACAVFCLGVQASLWLWLTGLVVLQHVGSQFHGQELNLCPLHWKGDS